LLATDPDREGEAISWHILESIKDSVNLDKIAVKRVVFHEITKKAIKEAIEHPRDVDDNLVHAYLARRALDYLFGFTLSPLLWRRLPGCKSAGRVQSVALRILVDRENEIEQFKSEEFWTVDGMCQFKRSKFVAHLVKLNDKKIAKMSIKDKDAAEEAKNIILNNEFLVNSVDKKTIKRSPPPPFITSTLQQEGARTRQTPRQAGRRDQRHALHRPGGQHPPRDHPRRPGLQRHRRRPRAVLPHDG
jgi:DNA topoisomerase-1